MTTGRYRDRITESITNAACFVTVPGNH